MACEQALWVALVAGWEKGRQLATTSLEFEFHIHSPVPPRRLRCHISANQHEVEATMNINKHCKTHAKGNDVITVISANQHFASTFSMEIFNPET